MLCCRCKREIPDGSNFCLHCGKRITATPPQRRTRRRAKGSGSVYKLKGNRAKPWVAYSGGLLGTYATAGEAVEALDRYNAQKLPADRLTFTIGDVWKSFLDSPAWAKLSDKGKEGLLVAWKRIEPLAGRRALSVSVFDWQEILDTATVKTRYKARSDAELEAMKPSERKRYEALCVQAEKPLGYDGKNRIKQLVSHLYDEMIRLQITKENPSGLLVLPAQRGKAKRNFTEQEKAVLLQHDDDPAVKIILIYISTGFRLNELLKLKKENIDMQARTITGGSKTEAGRDRVVPILDSIFPYVQYFYDMPGEYLIEKNGRPLTDDTFRRGMFYPTLQKLGINYQDESGRNVLTPHRARHTFVADSIKGGVSPEALTKIAGYSKYETAVDKYADDLGVDYLREELEKKRK